jgi:hypothetical protein
MKSCCEQEGITVKQFEITNNSDCKIWEKNCFDFKHTEVLTQQQQQQQQNLQNDVAVWVEQRFSNFGPMWSTTCPGALRSPYSISK